MQLRERPHRTRTHLLWHPAWILNSEPKDFSLSPYEVHIGECHHGKKAVMPKCFLASLKDALTSGDCKVGKYAFIPMATNEDVDLQLLVNQ